MKRRQYPHTHSLTCTLLVKLHKRIIGVQFHPEKSGINGLNFLQKVVLYASQGYGVSSN